MIAEEGVVTPSPHFLCPPWSGRYGIEVYSTTRVGGFSEEPYDSCLLYTSPSPRDRQKSRMPSSA